MIKLIKPVSRIGGMKMTSNHAQLVKEVNSAHLTLNLIAQIVDLDYVDADDNEIIQAVASVVAERNRLETELIRANELVDILKKL
jgi:UTP:GlnB (protein PII) uridylyltransferase